MTVPGTTMLDNDEEVKQGAPEWVVTFGDMMSLLLCFFILILSFSTIEEAKFKSLAGFLREAFNLGSFESQSQIDMGKTQLSTDSRADVSDSKDFVMLHMARQVVESAGMENAGHVEVTDRGVSIRMSGDSFFRTGSTELLPQARNLLDEIAELARSQAGMVEIEGHTDDVPIATARFPSNWELSGARAGAAARYLTGAGLPSSRIKAVGYADTRPVAPNDSAENRARNRRIEILFVRGEKDRRRATGTSRSRLSAPAEGPAPGSPPAPEPGGTS